MAPAVRRAAAAVVRRVAATARSAAAAPPRASAINQALPRATAIHRSRPRAAAPPSAAAGIHRAGSRSASLPRAATPHSAVDNNAASSFAPTPAARSATPLSAPTIGHLPTGRLGAKPRRLISIAPYNFKIQRRHKHQRANQKAIPEEVQTELKRIEAESFKNHKELQQSIANLSKQVAESTVKAKADKVDSTWQMGKTAWTACSTILATAAVSGCAVLQFVKFGWGRKSRDAAATMLDAKISDLKEALEKRMDNLLEEKENDEAVALSSKAVELDQKSLLLDKKEAELKAREEAIAAKEAAAKKPPK